VDTLDAVLRSRDFVAVLTREVSVQLVNISGSGCLLESDTKLREGTTASLRVMLQGVEYVEDVRVIRCSPSEGPRSYQLGAEFLWTTSPSERSLRRALVGLAGGTLKAGPAEPSVRM
jgi:hypothetical protein